MTLARGLSPIVRVGFLLMLLTSCASVPPTPVNDIGPLVGGWSGTVDLGGPLVPFYLTIYANQSLVATWGIVWNWGTITIANGQASYQMSPPIREGTLRFYAGNGKPTLYMDDLWLSFHAVVTKLPPGTPAIEGIPPAESN